MGNSWNEIFVYKLEIGSSVSNNIFEYLLIETYFLYLRHLTKSNFTK